MPLLRVVRDSGYADRLRAYKILVDGNTLGTIKDGEIKEFPISDGQHGLSLKIDWCGSRTAHFTIADGDVFTFEVRSNLRGPKIFFGLWYITVARNSYVVLERR